MQGSEEDRKTGGEGVAGSGSGRRYPRWHWVGAEPDDDSADGRFRRKMLALAREVLLAQGVPDHELPPAAQECRHDQEGRLDSLPDGCDTDIQEGQAREAGAGHAGDSTEQRLVELLDIGGTTSVAIENAARAVRQALSSRPGSTGSVTTDRLLLAVARSPAGATIGALARTVGASASTVSTAVSALAKEGLVDRRPLPSDRRRKRVTITTEGRLRAERVAARWRHVEDGLLAGLSPHERAELRRLLGRAAVASVQ